MTCYLDLKTPAGPVSIAKIDFKKRANINKTGLVQLFPHMLQSQSAFCDFSIYYIDHTWFLRSDTTELHVSVNGIPTRENRLKFGDIIKSGPLEFQVRLFPKWRNFSQFSDWIRKVGNDWEPVANLHPLYFYISHHISSFALVIDAASDENIPAYLADEGCELTSLLQGKVARELMFEAPYLCPLKPHGVIEQDYFALGIDGNWGILLQIDFYEEKKLLEVLRPSLWAEMNNDTLFFRYYDPRVARNWLVNLSDDNRNAFFGDVIMEVLIPFRNSIVSIDRTGVVREMAC